MNMEGCANCGEKFKSKMHGYCRTSLDAKLFTGSQSGLSNEPLQATGREALEKMTGLSFVTRGTNKRQSEFICFRCLGLLKLGYRCHCAMNEFWKLTQEDSYVMHCLSPDYLRELQSCPDFAAGITKPTQCTYIKQVAQKKPLLESRVKKKKTSRWGSISVSIANRHYASAVRGIYNATAGSKRQFLNVVKKEVRKEVRSLLLSDICLCQKADLMCTTENIPWNEVIEVLRDKAPMLYAVLTGAVSTKKTEHDLRRGKNSKVDKKPMIGTALSTLLFAKSPIRASYLPTVISLLLQRKRAKQRTLRELSKLGLCLAVNRTCECYIRLKEEFDTATFNCSSRAENIERSEEEIVSDSQARNDIEKVHLDSQDQNTVEEASSDLLAFVSDELSASAVSPLGNTKPSDSRAETVVRSEEEIVSDPQAQNGTEEGHLDSQDQSTVEEASSDLLASCPNDELSASALAPWDNTEPSDTMMSEENEPEMETDASETDISSVEDDIYTDGDDELCLENVDDISNTVLVNNCPETCNVHPTEESLDPGFTLLWNNASNPVVVGHPYVNQQNAKAQHSLGCLAVNRVSTAHLDYSDRATVSASDIPLSVFTPSSKDFHELQSRMTVIVSRILTRHLKWFREFFDDCTVEHVSHNHSLESAQRSLLLNLGAVDQSSGDGNIDLINCVKKYITDGTGHCVPSVIFRDNAEFGCVTPDHDVLRFGTLISDAQEFQKEVVLLENYYNDFLKEASSEEKGTLYHLLNIVHSSGDKLETFSQRWDRMCEATESFVILAAMEIMGLKNLSDRPPSAVKTLETSSLKKRRAFLDAVSKQIIQLVWHETDTDALNVPSSNGAADYCCHEDRDEGVVRCKSGRGCVKGELFHYSCAGVAQHHHPDEWYCSGECEQNSRKTYKYCVCSQDMGKAAMIRCAAQHDCSLKEWYHLKCIDISEEELPSIKWYCTEKCRLLCEESARQSSRLVKKRKTNTSYLPDYKYRYNTALVWRGLNLLCRRDAVREGDGDAMLSYWTIDLLDFYRTNKFKSLTSAHRLLSSVNGWLPEKIEQDLRWNRTINFTGGSGRNLPTDLVNDILNRLFSALPKSQIDYYMSKTCSDTNPHLELCEDSVDVVFDRKMIQREAKLYTRRDPTMDKHVRVIVKSLTGQDLFKVVPGRQYKAFSVFKYDINPKPGGKFGLNLVQLGRRLDKLQFK